MTDKNTAALAADHPEHPLDMVGRWYMVNKHGMATLCTYKEDAENEAADAQRFWPHMGPHRAVRLVEASFEAADMATAAAQGFRDGVAHAAETIAELETLRAENETLTLYKNLADEYGLSIFKDLEDLGDAADDVQLLRTGYAAARGDALDTMRLDWLDADESRCVFHLGKSWYTRPSYGLPYRKRASLREAIDAARAAQEVKSND